MLKKSAAAAGSLTTSMSAVNKIKHGRLRRSLLTLGQKNIYSFQLAPHIRSVPDNTSTPHMHCRTLDEINDASDHLYKLVQQNSYKKVRHPKIGPPQSIFLATALMYPLDK